MKFLFVHGGPGLNSNPEANLLKDRFEDQHHEIYFWNESSAQNVSYKAVAESLKKTIAALSIESKIAIIAHSFGAFLLNEILPEVEHHLSKIILLNPVSNLFELDINILKASEKTLADTNKSKTLSDFIQSSTPSPIFSDDRLHALIIAGENPSLTACYWFQKNLMSSYYEFMLGPEFSFNFDSFVSIRRTCSKNQISNKTEIETLVIYGVHDPFINFAEYSRLKDYYKNSQLFIFEESSHYSHIEESEFFYDTVFKDHRYAPSKTSSPELNQSYL